MTYVTKTIPLPECLKNRRTGKRLAKSTIRRKLRAWGKQMDRKVTVRFTD